MDIGFRGKHLPKKKSPRRCFFRTKGIFLTLNGYIMKDNVVRCMLVSCLMHWKQILQWNLVRKSEKKSEKAVIGLFDP